MIRLEHDSSDHGLAHHPVGVALPAYALARPALVLGFGNILLCDDGAGVRVIEQLQRDPGVGAAQFIDAGTMSFNLLCHVEATDSMLVVDAADLGGAAGTLELFEGAAMDAFLRTTRRRSVHEVGLIDLLDMARLRGRLPPLRALLCIQPLCIDWSETLSPSVAAALPAAAALAGATLARWSNA